MKCLVGYHGQLALAPKLHIDHQALDIIYGQIARNILSIQGFLYTARK